MVISQQVDVTTTAELCGCLTLCLCGCITQPLTHTQAAPRCTVYAHVGVKNITISNFSLSFHDIYKAPTNKHRQPRTILYPFTQKTKKSYMENVLFKHSLYCRSRVKGV